MQATGLRPEDKRRDLLGWFGLSGIQGKNARQLKLSLDIYF
jgi:hypothetical protein